MNKIFLSLIVMAITINGFAQLNATISSQTNVLCHGLCNGSATVTATGGTAPYTYNWSNVPANTTQTATNLCAGIYTVTVTDYLAATTTASVTITEPIQIVVTLTTANVICFGDCNGVITANVMGGNPPFTYFWSNGMITTSTINACAGIYTVTITDNNGCTTAATAVVSQPPLFVATASSVPDTCSQGHGTASINASGGNAPYMYTWSTAANMPTITNLFAGTYTVTATESNGCTAVAFATVNNLAPSANLGSDYSICNGICDTITVHPIGGSTIVSYLWSNQSTNDSLVICPTVTSNYSLTVSDAYGCTATDNINVNLVQHCNTISGTFYEDLDNDGIKDAGENPLQNMVAMLTPGPLYATSNSSGYYEFLVDTGNFVITPVNNSVYTTMSPASHTATMYNAYQTDALNDFGVYVSAHGDLRVILSSSAMRPGFASVYYITYYNDGTDTMNATINLNLSNVPVYTSCSPAYSSNSGNLYTWNITGIEPNVYHYIYFYVNIPPTITLGTIVSSDATILPIVGDDNPANNYSSDNRVVSGSWDPNDKAVSPSGVFPPALVAAGNYLNYTIRFQNTGTDTAFNIHITDTLSYNLDVSSFEMVSSSHPCNFNLHDAGIVDFVFNNIQLPDSGINQAGSNGYVSYKVKPENTLGIGDEVQNTAYIYFDFNQPVMTNTVSTMIEEIQFVTYSKFYDNVLNVWPNPSKGDFMLACNLNNNGTVSIEVTDILGKIVLNEIIESISNIEFKHSLHLNGKGLYFVKVKTSDEVYTAKIIITE
ncbi:MAG: T9SS type A sorting domain-containing protein [Bacteroidia bacterium]|nr:T9SS type A sorting domain-containing protein [Bacteroidia bacterium]